MGWSFLDVTGEEWKWLSSCDDKGRKCANTHTHTHTDAPIQPVIHSDIIFIEGNAKHINKQRSKFHECLNLICGGRRWEGESFGCLQGQTYTEKCFAKVYSYTVASGRKQSGVYFNAARSCRLNRVPIRLENYISCWVASLCKHRKAGWN